MASLYIKDQKTAALAAEIARRSGQTKTAVVRKALQEFALQLPPESTAQSNVEEWYREYRMRNALRPSTGLKADKAFFDSLNDEDDDDLR